MLDEELAAGVELNHAETLRLHGLLPWVQLHDDGDVLRVFAGDTWPANAVALARFTQESAQDRVRAVLAPHLEAKVSCSWVLGPTSQPANLGQHLRAHGFSCRIHCAGMACDLGRLPRKPPQPAKLDLAQLADPLPLQSLTTERRRNRHRALGIVLSSKPRMVWHFTACLAGKPVGETSLVTGAGFAGLYGVVVLEAFRGRGIGTSLVFAALEQARALGFSAAVLSATGMGRRIYERLGFREVCKLSFWKYGKMRQLD